MTPHTRIVLLLLAAFGMAASPAMSRLPASSPHTGSQDGQAEARAALSRVQTAMGGAAELAKITSLRISSTQNQWASNGAPSPSETLVVKMLLPHYVLFEQQGDPRRGWAVDTPIARGEPAASRARLKEDFAYVALRTLLRTDTPFRLTLRAFVNGSLQYDAPNGVKVFLDIDPQTHLPSRLHFSEVSRTNAGDPIPGSTLDQRWDLEDYRNVGNVRLAHRWIYFRNGMRQIVDQTVDLELNPPLTREDFVR